LPEEAEMEEMTTRACLRNLPIAPRKVRVVADQIRGMDADVALDLLRFIPKAAAPKLRKLLDSAIANATTTHSMDADSLYVHGIWVDQARMLKRWKPRAFGRASRILKKTSHVTLVLGVR
jgi:large subunit ribosomal protein L22